MALNQRLDLRQSQSLVMTPQLQQAIKLLQLSNMELASFVEAELETNPLLERDEGAGAPVEGEAPIDLPAVAAPEPVDTLDFASRDTIPADHDLPLDTGPSEPSRGTEDGTDLGSLEAGLIGWGQGGGGAPEDGEFGIEQTATRALSLKDHLEAQLGVDVVDPGDRLIALHLIDLIDAAGYLSADYRQVAHQLGCGEDRVERIVGLLQKFDPIGVAARSLAECLALQLAERDRLDPAMKTLIDNLPLLANRDYEQLKRLCGVDHEDLVEMVGEIQALNPKPGQAFDHELFQPITPDILMRADGEGGWMVELNSETLPRVLVNSRYFTRVARQGMNRTDKEYLSEKLQSANWLVKSLDQRANTILKVASELVRQQDAFFAHGVQHLRPLILRDIAAVVGMHESTISRVTTNKYLASPRGIFELKYFFTSSIASSEGGAAHSAEAVRHRIRALIASETPDDVYSDDRIVEILMKDGIDIARRTVAKYREAMRIPSSVQRRRNKNFKL